MLKNLDITIILYTFVSITIFFDSLCWIWLCLLLKVFDITMIDYTNKKKGFWHKFMSPFKTSKSDRDTCAAYSQPDARFDNLLAKQRSIIHYIHSLIREKDPDKAIQNMLNDLLDFLKVDHTCIIEYDLLRGVTNCTYEALRENVISIKESCRELPISQFTWWTEQIKKDTPIVYSKLEEMPADGALVRQKMEEQGVKSIMVVPFISKDESLGYICADMVHEYRNWEDDDYQWFFSFSNVISIYIELRRRDARRQRTNNRLQQFEEIFKLIADYAKVGYARYNAITKEGYASDSWYYNVGATPDMSLNELLNDMTFIHPDDRETIRRFTFNAIEGESEALRKNIRIIRGKGKYSWSCFNCLVRDSHVEEGMVDILSINYDITELKEMEQKLIEARNKAEASDKLKSAFLANMSHEIRTPLNAIIGFSDLLVDCDNREERQQYVSIMRNNGDILVQLISDILNISQIESGGSIEIKKNDVEVNTLCNEVIASFQMKTTENVSINLEKGMQECHIQSDALRIKQILSNLLSNAIKFTPNGSIILGYQYVSENELKFYVRDTGIGIPADKIDSIFDRFVKLNSFITGTGLGLPVCKCLVEQLHGVIGVESEEGKGSCFWFTHPVT